MSREPHVVESGFIVQIKRKIKRQQRQQNQVFSSFYKEIIFNRKKNLAMMIEIHSCIFSQYLWYNESVQVDKAFVYLSFLRKVSIMSCNFLVTMIPLKMT